MSATPAPPRRVEIAVAVVEDAGRYLIGLREPKAALTGLWEFPGGKIHQGESPAQAAMRECLEETGLQVRVTAGYREVCHDYDHARVRLHFFACEVVVQQRPLPERFRWVAAADLTSYAFPAANSALVESLAARRAVSTKRNAQ